MDVVYPRGLVSDDAGQRDDRWAIVAGFDRDQQLLEPAVGGAFQCFDFISPGLIQPQLSERVLPWPRIAACSQRLPQEPCPIPGEGGWKKKAALRLVPR